MASDQVETLRLTNNVDIAGLPILPYMICLMQAVDCVRSAFRWLMSLEHDDSHEGRCDRINAVVTCCGWAYESIKVIRHGKRAGYITRIMLGDNKELLRCWDDCIEDERLSNSRVAKNIERVRHHCFGHWDEGEARAFVQTRPETFKNEPFAETRKDGHFLHTCYPWGQALVVHVLLGQLDGAGKGLGAYVEDVRDLHVSMSEMADYLLVALCKKHGVHLELVSSQPESAEH